MTEIIKLIKIFCKVQFVIFYISFFTYILNEMLKILGDKTTGKIKIKRRVRQEDTSSPKLVTLPLEDGLNWKKRGTCIDSQFLSHLRFSDNITIISNSAEELQDIRA